MSVVNEMMTKVIEDCDLLFEGKKFTRELLLRAFAQYLSLTFDKDKHNVGYILHTGSLLFDAVAIAYAAISNLVFNDSRSDDILLSLEVGDSVLYGDIKKSRYTFQGFTSLPQVPNQEYVLLTQGDAHKIYVPKSRWRLISPYLGTSKRFDGRGIKKQTGIREEFFVDVLGFNREDIPSVIDTSTVIVMPRERADLLVNGLSICFGGRRIRLLELITASYFTENEEYYYGGNTAKTEPVLKFTGKISVARSLLLSRDGNKNVGLLVMGDETISRGITELPELINRKSIRYIYVSTHIDSEHGLMLLNECPDASLFACTKDFLLSNSKGVCDENILTLELSRQVDAIIDHDVEAVNLSGHFSWDQYKNVRKNMFIIKNSDFDTEEKETFLIRAYALMKLLLTASFKITELEKMIENGTLDLVSPIKRLEELSVLAESFPPHLSDQTHYVIDIIETAYLLLTEKSEKEEYLRRFISENSGHTIAIVVPKAYYASVMRESGLYALVENESNLIITTANRFDNSRIYDEVICTGDFEGRKFNTFRCRSASRVITLLFDFEHNLFMYKMRKAVRLEEVYNSHSAISYVIENDIDDLYYTDNASDAELGNIEAITEEVDEYINRLNEIADIRSFGLSAAPGNNTTEAIAIARFESGETAFFTKMYKAYVFDDNSGEVKECGVYDLSEGDSVVFTKNNEETHDIVDEMLSKLISGGKMSAEIVDCYQKSKRWKTKLIEYMKDTQQTAKEIAKLMIASGVTVQEMTIRTWLDEDAHTVGPRSKDSIQQIALLVEDDEMFENYELYYEACAVIRRLRREILKTVGEAIINKLRGVSPEPGTLIAEIFDRIDSLALVLRLDSISFIVRNVPFNATNRPVKIKE